MGIAILVHACLHRVRVVPSMGLQVRQQSVPAAAQHTPNHSLYTHSEVNSLDFPAGPSTGPLMVWSAMICGWEEQIQGGGRGRQRLGAHGGFVRSRAERKSLRMAQVVHEHKQPGHMRMCSRQGALSLRC